MNTGYTSITVIGNNAVSDVMGGSLPLLPFAYYIFFSETPGRVVLYPEVVRNVPNAGDYAAAHISMALSTAVVVLAEVDSEDTLRLRFFREGNPIDEYLTEPGQSTGEELPPSGGNVNLLAELFELSDQPTLEQLSQVLRAARYDDEFGFGEARERHGDIAQLLNLPDASVGCGYSSIQQGSMPEDATAKAIRHCPANSSLIAEGITLRQYVLFRPKEGESAAQYAARFLPDVITWEDDFLNEGMPFLGSVGELRTHIMSVLPSFPWNNDASWLTAEDGAFGRLDIDLLGSKNDTPVEHVTLFSLSKNVPEELFLQLCGAEQWVIWSYETRQTVNRPADNGR